MLELAFLLLIPSAVAIAILDVVLRTVLGRSVWWATEENMPVKLMLSRIYMSEVPLSTHVPVPLHGTPDQVFEGRKGQLIPVDTKLRGRHRVEQSDIVQLSVYGVILAQTQHERRIAPYGYVRTVVLHGASRHRVRYHKVWLLPERAVISMHRTRACCR